MSTWDVRNDDGSLVTTLAGLAAALVTTREGAAKSLLSDADLFAAAPVELVAEVKSAITGGDTPPPISTGSFVSWSGGKGRVDLIVKKGKVPGVSGDVEATDDSPAARIVVWKDGKATGEKIAASTHTLKRIEPLTGGGQKDAIAALVEIATEHERAVEERGLPAHARVSGVAVKTVFDRGMESWPGYSHTPLHREDWAVGRVEHFVKVAAGEVEAKSAGHDTDLLDPTHPVVTGEEVVTISRDDLDAQVKSLLDGVDLETPER